jgi:TorA maturation chaperone TorD
LAQAAGRTHAAAVEREYFDLFVGLGRGELLPYASFYLTGFLHGHTMARLRHDLVELGLRRSPDICEPEDHAAILCALMSGLVRRLRLKPSARCSRCTLFLGSATSLPIFNGPRRRNSIAA